MTIQVQYQKGTYVLNEDGEFRCPHYNAEVTPPCCNGSPDEAGRDTCACHGLHSVYCPDCKNEDMSESDVERILDNYKDSKENFDG